MTLTTAQLTTIKADILLYPVLSAQQNNSDGAFAIAAAYNLIASPDFWVWKTNLSEQACVAETGPEGTVWSWPQYIARTEPERDGWKRLFAADSTNPSLPNVRQAVADIFGGAQAAPTAQRTHLLAIARRKATRAEKLFATGTGSTAIPATMIFEGSNLSFQDVIAALSLP